MTSSLGTMGKAKTSLLGVKIYRIKLFAHCLRTASSTTYIPVFEIFEILDFVIIFLKKKYFLKFLGSKKQSFKNPR